MLSVFILAGDDAEALARTLATLVPHAVDGMISDATAVVEGSPSASVQTLCHQAGCELVDSRQMPVDQILAHGRAPWLLILTAGVRPLSDWTEPVRAHVQAPTGAGPARFKLARAAGPWWRRMMGRSAGGGPFHRGLLIDRRQALARCKPDMTLDALPRGLAVRTLSAALDPA